MDVPDLGWFEVSLNVRDIDASLAFYEKLGFTIVDGTPANRFLTLQRQDCRIALYQGFLDPPETQLIFWQGDINAIGSALENQGLVFERRPSVASDGGTAAMLLDPDGHPIYFVNMPGVTRGSGG